MQTMTREPVEFVAVAREGELRGEVGGTPYLEREAHPLQRHSARLVASFKPAASASTRCCWSSR